ncbi:fibronectin type III domain-containing protein [Ruminococcus sp.]|uniref:fibronectin type III domain-containing protein n=1 Tax=Ruminococcus sp. TaxID=41978 RepID=UPI00258F5A95|nr:fibronectin type III domain-containing protein [Ruminococcus sp.]MCR5020860.1 fibronectin type III domain-containing protein [Ruminococcus sp.]
MIERIEHEKKNFSYAGTGKSTLSKTLVTYRLSRPMISSLASSAATKLTAKWGKNAKGTGYEIQCSLKSGFSTIAKEAPVTSKATVSKTLTKLTSGKTYYVRVRTYKTVSGTKYYSAWSEPKSVKVK